MEYLIASGVGLMTAAGVFLILRRHTFPVILGLALLSYAVNLFIFASGLSNGLYCGVSRSSWIFRRYRLRGESFVPWLLVPSVSSYESWCDGARSR